MLFVINTFFLPANKSITILLPQKFLYKASFCSSENKILTVVSGSITFSTSICHLAMEKGEVFNKENVCLCYTVAK